MDLAGIKNWLTLPRDGYVLGVFRILFGIFMTYEIIDYFRIGLVKNMFVLPAINFQYDYLRWLKPLPEAWLNVILAVLLASAIAITLGLFFKWACRLFAVGYLYIFLLDKSIYNNHIYLFILIAFLLSLTDADKNLSVTSKKPNIRVANWQQLILQFQIIVVYFYGGLAKLKYDWIVERQPMKTLIAGISDEGFLSLLKNEFGVIFFTYGGLLIDLGAPVLLWNRKIRQWAIYPIILFHFINSQIFGDIGIFPFIMIGCLILFYKAEELPFLNKLVSKTTTNNKTSRKKEIRSHVKTKGVPLPVWIITCYVLFQLLFPLRGYFLPNDMDWTTIGNRFSWRMKIDTRTLKEMNFALIDRVNNQSAQVGIQQLLNDMQILNMSMDPRSVADFAKMIESRSMRSDLENLIVNASIKVSYNGRPDQDFIKPQTDMTNVDYSPLKKLDWVNVLAK